MPRPASSSCRRGAARCGQTHLSEVYCNTKARRASNPDGSFFVGEGLTTETGDRVTLPSEAQWEKAARGQDGRQFPWGDQIDPNRANYDMNIEMTSVVGCFPGGASPYGVLDLSGNVLEWCATRWQSGYENYRDENDLEGTAARVLRGGVFHDLQRRVRCACRDYSGPGDVDSSVSFRMVVAPGMHL